MSSVEVNEPTDGSVDNRGRIEPGAYGISQPNRLEYTTKSTAFTEYTGADERIVTTVTVKELDKEFAVTIEEDKGSVGSKDTVIFSRTAAKELKRILSSFL